MPFLDDVFSGTVPDCDSLDKTHPRARKKTDGRLYKAGRKPLVILFCYCCYQMEVIKLETRQISPCKQTPYFQNGTFNKLLHNSTKQRVTEKRSWGIISG